MVIALTMDGKTLEDKVSLQFEACNYLLVVDVFNMSVDVIENKMAFTGEKLAKKIIDLKCEGVITGKLTPIAFDTLANAGITRFQGAGYTGLDALVFMKKKELKLIRYHEGSEKCTGNHNH